MIVLDTSVVIDCFTGARRGSRALRGVIERGERLAIPSIVLYEWLRGPRRLDELADQETLLPRESALPFGPQEAAVAAELYTAVKNPRRREVDLAIAACAITHAAEFWTLNPGDFRDLPRLVVSTPATK